jgi:hypothetical protein
MGLTPVDLARVASLAGIDLAVRDGRLHAALPDDAPPELVATLKAHRHHLIACLEEYATNGTMRTGYASRVSHLPALTPAEHAGAEVLAHELAASGGLGQFACDLCARWNHLSDRDRLAAVTAWQLAAESLTLELAA